VNSDQPGSGEGAVVLRAVDVDNWRAVATLRVPEDQRDFSMGAAYYLSLCHYGDIWHPFAIYFQGDVVGFVMWAVDPADNSGWIGGLLIDADRQGRGLGRATMERMLEFLRDEQRCGSAALTYTVENERAKRLYASLGFVESGEWEGDEPVARRQL
jgi:diamine N-acetyltransferase